MPHDPKKAREVAQKIDAMIQRELGYQASFVLAYSEPDFLNFHWITNVSREGGLAVISETLRQMKAEGN